MLGAVAKVTGLFVFRPRASQVGEPVARGKIADAGATTVIEDVHTQLAGPFEEIQVAHGVVEQVEFFACGRDEHIYRRIPARGPILNGVPVRDQIDAATPSRGVKRQGLLDGEQHQRDAEDQCPYELAVKPAKLMTTPRKASVLQRDKPPPLAAREVPVLLCVGRRCGVPTRDPHGHGAAWIWSSRAPAHHGRLDDDLDRGRDGFAVDGPVGPAEPERQGCDEGHGVSLEFANPP